MNQLLWARDTYHHVPIGLLFGGFIKEPLNAELIQILVPTDVNRAFWTMVNINDMTWHKIVYERRNEGMVVVNDVKLLLDAIKDQSIVKELLNMVNVNDDSPIQIMNDYVTDGKARDELSKIFQTYQIET